MHIKSALSHSWNKWHFRSNFPSLHPFHLSSCVSSLNNMPSSALHWTWPPHVGLPKLQKTANQSTPDRAEQTTDIYCLTILEARSLRSRHQRADSSWGCERESVPDLSGSIWCLAGDVWCSSAWRPPPWPLPLSSHGILPVCLSVSKFPLFIRAPVQWD